MSHSNQSISITELSYHISQITDQMPAFLMNLLILPNSHQGIINAHERLLFCDMFLSILDAVRF